MRLARKKGRLPFMSDLTNAIAHSCRFHRASSFRSSRIGLQSLLQDKQRAGEVFFLQYIGDADLVDARSRRGIETRSRSHENSLPFVLEIRKTPCAELVGIVYGEFGNRIESSHRNGRIDAGNAVQPVDEAFAALHIFIVRLTRILLGCVE